MLKPILAVILYLFCGGLVQAQKPASSNHWEQVATDLKFDESSGQLLFGQITDNRYVAASDFPRWFARNSGWSEQDGLKLIGEFKDDLGMLH